MSLLARRALAIAALLCMSGLGQAQGGFIGSVTFDEPQLVDNDPLLQFYNGGTTYRGIGGGPDLGVSFSLNARVRTLDVLTGAYTPPGYMELYSDSAREGEGISARMDVAGGFTSGVLFFYASIDAVGRLRVFSGLDGTGDTLADLFLPITSPQSGPGLFVTDSVTFSGVARSIVFDGGNKQLAFDDLTLTFSVPEPPAFGLLAVGVVLCQVVLSLQSAARRLSRRRST
jgi:hypothetical protein